MAGISAFRSEAARAAYCSVYDEALANSPISVSESDIETSFGRTHVLTAGDPSKPPLVALHGMSMGATSWLPLLPVLVDDHHVTMVDSIGQLNKSVATKSVASSAHVVGWLDETLRALSITEAAFVGFSMGSWIAAQYAMQYPARVERLAMLGPAGLVCKQHLGWTVHAMMTMGIRPTEARVGAFFDGMAMPASKARLRQLPWEPIARQFVVGSLSFKAAYNTVRPGLCNMQRLAEADMPVLVVVGADETLHDGPTMAALVGERLPRARVELVKNANHLVQVDQPEIVEGLLDDFLQ
jgi:pimeloyl-ACP methyl ester carboxylesterase